MKAVGLDTNVVLRLLLGEPKDQADIALRFVESCFSGGVAVHVSDLVISEAYHALIYHYEVPESEAREQLISFLSSPMIAPQGHALSVLQNYKETGAGFMDRLIRMGFLDHAHEVVTFDKTFSKMDHVRLLK